MSFGFFYKRVGTTATGKPENAVLDAEGGTEE